MTLVYVCFRQSEQGKKKTRKTRDKMKKQIADLQKSLDQERRSKEKYTKRLQRLGKKNLSSSTDEASHVTSNVRKTLLHHKLLTA